MLLKDCERDWERDWVRGLGKGLAEGLAEGLAVRLQRNVCCSYKNKTYFGFVGSIVRGVHAGRGRGTVWDP